MGYHDAYSMLKKRRRIVFILSYMIFRLTQIAALLDNCNNTKENYKDKKDQVALALPTQDQIPPQSTIKNKLTATDQLNQVT